MNTIVRERDNRDHQLMAAYYEDRIDALKRALDVCSRRIVELERIVEQRDDVIDAMRKAGR